MGLIKNIIQVLKSENIFILILDLQLSRNLKPAWSQSDRLFEDNTILWGL